MKKRFKPFRAPLVGLLVAASAFFAYAVSASALAGHNTVFSDDIKNGQVKSADIKNKGVRNVDLATSAVNSRVIKNGTILLADLNATTIAALRTGTPGPAGATGATGPAGPAGPAGSTHQVTFTRNLNDGQSSLLADNGGLQVVAFCDTTGGTTRIEFQNNSGVNNGFLDGQDNSDGSSTGFFDDGEGFEVENEADIDDSAVMAIPNGKSVQMAKGQAITEDTNNNLSTDFPTDCFFAGSVTVTG
jgi:hypothetical protein